jgi:hypothetical protein
METMGQAQERLLKINNIFRHLRLRRSNEKSKAKRNSPDEMMPQSVWK